SVHVTHSPSASKYKDSAPSSLSETSKDRSIEHAPSRTPGPVRGRRSCSAGWNGLLAPPDTSTSRRYARCHSGSMCWCALSYERSMRPAGESNVDGDSEGLAAPPGGRRREGGVLSVGSGIRSADSASV